MKSKEHNKLKPEVDINMWTESGANIFTACVCKRLAVHILLAM